MGFDEVWADAHADLVSPEFFGVPATIERPGGASFETHAVRQDSEEYAEEGEVTISTAVRSYNVHLPDCDFEPQEGDKVTAHGIEWHVYAARDEGAGVMRLEVHRGEGV